MRVCHQAGLRGPAIGAVKGVNGHLVPFAADVPLDFEDGAVGTPAGSGAVEVSGGVGDEAAIGISTVAWAALEVIENGLSLGENGRGQEREQSTSQ